LFEIEASSTIQQQFIESERTGLLIHLQEFFNNPKVQFRILIDPAAAIQETTTEQALSQRDQYLRMISLYPMVKELRDRLNLDLD
jgi:hypothetical protein